jgi:hypothetical protein
MRGAPQVGFSLQTETLPMPTNYRIRPCDQKRIRPLRPQSAQYHHPEQSVGTAQARPLGSAFQYHQLLPQSDDFKPQVMTRPNKTSQPREQTQDQPMHESALITRLEGALVVDPPNCVLATYRRENTSASGQKPESERFCRTLGSLRQGGMPFEVDPIQRGPTVAHSGRI